MCRRLTVLFSACVLLLTIRPALAVVVYDHGLNTPLCCFTDNDFDAFSPEEYAEDFSLAGAATIRSVKLRGVYLSGGPTVTDNFTFSFYADAGGTPDTTAFASFNVGTGPSLTRVDT